MGFAPSALAALGLVRLCCMMLYSEDLQPAFTWSMWPVTVARLCCSLHMIEGSLEGGGPPSAAAAVLPCIAFILKFNVMKKQGPAPALHCCTVYPLSVSLRVAVRQCAVHTEHFR